MKYILSYESLNLSSFSDDDTARTNYDSAMQRAENLSIMGVKSVLELCVGPSLKVLEYVYSRHGISVIGNDIDPRWSKYYPQGNWIIGDCFEIDYGKYDAVVFAPPLSLGCSGKREDSLCIDNINPKYLDFIKRSKQYKGVKVMVLPARSLSTNFDRKQFYKLLSNIDKYDIVELFSGKRNIRKYIDVYF